MKKNKITKFIFTKFLLMNLCIFLLINLSYAGENIPVHFTGVKPTTSWCVYAGKVYINGKQAVDNEDELGVFVKDNNGNLILAGSCILGQIVSDHFFLNIYGDDTTTNYKDGAVNNDKLIFKIWDSSDKKEYHVLNSSLKTSTDNDLTIPLIPPIWQNNKDFGLLIINYKNIVGDINLNSKIDMVDVQILLNKLVKNTE